MTVKYPRFDALRSQCHVPVTAILRQISLLVILRVHYKPIPSPRCFARVISSWLQLHLVTRLERLQKIWPD